MKILGFALVYLTSIPANADLIAHIATNRGDIEVVLEYQKAPRTVANFITLAEGTRARIDPNTGLLTKAPLYDGQSFYTVVNEPGSFPFGLSTVYALTGSGTANSEGSPGFTLPDEFDPTLTHGGYTVSMATLANFTGQFLGSEINRGPNTNGSQIMLSGSSAITRFNNANTVFGAISDSASRAIVDSIMSSDAGTTTITGVTIERTDQAAIDFDEHAQGLPTVGAPVGKFRVEPGAAFFDHSPPLGSGSFFDFSRSADLSGWTPTTNRHIDPDLAPEASTQMDSVGASQAFYQMFLTRHPGSLTPASLANRTLTITTTFGGVTTYTFVFDSSGTTGTANYSVDGSEGVIEDLTYTPQGYGAFFEISTSNIPTPLRAQLSFDSEDGSNYVGRHYLVALTEPFSTPQGSGTLTLSKLPD